MGYAEEYDSKNPYSQFREDAVFENLVRVLPRDLRAEVESYVFRCSTNQHRKYIIMATILNLRQSNPSTQQFHNTLSDLVNSPSSLDCAKSFMITSAIDLGLDTKMKINNRVEYLSFQLSQIINIREANNFKNLPPFSRVKLEGEDIYTEDWNKPFDSAQYSLSEIPVVYLQGFNDTATHLQQAIYHYSRQNTVAQFYVFKTLGHSPALESGCGKQFFEEASGMRSKFEDCLNKNGIEFSKRQKTLQ